MNVVHSWWDWCSQSLSHTFAGVTAPLLLIAGASVVLFYSSQGGDGTTPLPPRSDIAGVCATAPSSAPTGSSAGVSCATVDPSGVAVTTPTPPPPTPTPLPRTYTVKAGDSLSRVCANEVPDLSLDDCLDRIVKLNSLSGPDEITEGQSLRLPPKSTATTSTTPTTSSQRPSATSTPAASLVAVGSGQAPAEEPTAAPVVEPTEVPTEEPTEVPTEEATAEPEAEVPDEEEPLPTAGQEYVIEEGDSLLGVCVSMVPDMDEDECVEFVVLLNDLSGPDQIQAGQTVFLP